MASTANRKINVNAGTSADGFIARPNGDIDWLTSRPKPAGFYDMARFTAPIDTKILGRKTYEKSLELGAKFDGKTKTYVISARIGTSRSSCSRAGSSMTASSNCTTKFNPTEGASSLLSRPNPRA